MAKGRIEVFTAGCPLCDDTLALIRQAVAACGFEVIERRCTDKDRCTEALQFGVRTMPSVMVDGEIVFEGRINRAQAALLTSTPQ